MLLHTHCSLFLHYKYHHIPLVLSVSLLLLLFCWGNTLTVKKILTLVFSIGFVYFYFLECIPTALYPTFKMAFLVQEILRPGQTVMFVTVCPSLSISRSPITQSSLFLHSFKNARKGL